MSKMTTNYGLIKPEKSDNYSVDVMAGNMDIIDAMVASKSTVDAMKEKVDAIELNNDGSITVGSATQLNKVVTVGVSDKLITLTRGGWSIFNLIPYVPGVLYTGVICCSTSSSSNPYDIYVLNSDNTYTKISVTATSPTDTSFSNAKCVYLNPTSGNIDYKIYLPTFS